LIFAKKAYLENSKLEFYIGNSEQLTENENLKGSEFDLIINVESSHCYGNFKKFVQEVDKLLRVGGIFAITDFRNVTEFPEMERDLTSFNLKIIKKENITPNVLHALKLDENRRLDLINGKVHSWLRPLFKKFSGLNGSRINEAMSKGETLYQVYVLEKQ